MEYNLKGQMIQYSTFLIISLFAAILF